MYIHLNQIIYENSYFYHRKGGLEWETFIFHLIRSIAKYFDGISKRIFHIILWDISWWEGELRVSTGQDQQGFHLIEAFPIVALACKGIYRMFE